MPSSKTAREGADRTVRLGGLSFHYREWGRAKMPALLVLHGLGHNASHWDPVAAALANGRRVLVLDQRGHGQSEWTAQYSFALMRDDLAAFVDALGLRSVDLVGHSMGGTIAYLYGIAQPAALRRLIIVDTAPPDPGSWPYTERPIPPAEFASFDEGLEFLKRGAPEIEEQRLRRYLEQSMVQLQSGRWRWQFDPVMSDAISKDLATGGPLIWQDLQRISVPTLLLWARNSFVPRERMERVRAAIATCTLVEIPNSTHDVNVDNPDALVRAVRTFLA
jgi:pimeloyl-ACP methyl ester carboxylesterase